MDRIDLQDYRCFRGEQQARLAPLTLLVGENSTGKTSFLALLRALWDVAYDSVVPDFKEEPYDLGSFEDIAYRRGKGRGEPHPAEFRAGFHQERIEEIWPEFSFSAAFEKRDTAPFPARREISNGDASLKIIEENGFSEVSYSQGAQTWRRNIRRSGEHDRRLAALYLPFDSFVSFEGKTIGPPLGDDILLASDIMGRGFRVAKTSIGSQRPFASAPVRSKPRRTYDPARAMRDPEGDYMPMYLANLSARDRDEWERLKSCLESFGKNAGLFDEIGIKRLGKQEGDPFQIHVRRFDGRIKGKLRNLVDVGYGVSQTLPIITELLRPDAPQMLLLQQPEVHLHPSAQAALGTLFCTLATGGRQLVVETHSDYIIDRIRMDVRDRAGEGGLTPEDVSILYFERGSGGVKIHSLRIGGRGNIEGAPSSYGAFFMAETQRSVGL